MLEVQALDIVTLSSKSHDMIDFGDSIRIIEKLAKLNVTLGDILYGDVVQLPDNEPRHTNNDTVLITFTYAEKSVVSVEVNDRNQAVKFYLLIRGKS